MKPTTLPSIPANICGWCRHFRCSPSAHARAQGGMGWCVRVDGPWNAPDTTRPKLFIRGIFYAMTPGENRIDECPGHDPITPDERVWLGSDPEHEAECAAGVMWMMDKEPLWADDQKRKERLRAEGKLP